MATYSSFKKIKADSIVDGSIAAVDIANNAITSGKIAANAVTIDKIAPGAVGTSQLGSTIDLTGKTVTYRALTNADVSSSAGIASAKMASGAMAANLGYTALNSSGGVMTGQLIVPDGSVSSPSIAQSGNTNTGIYFDGSNNVNFAANGTKQLSIDSSGRMLRGTAVDTGTVAFRADGTAGWTYNNSYGGTGWRHLNSNFGWSVTQRGGSNCDGNGIFTAPVSGFYHFMFQTYGHNDGDGTGSHIHLSFGRNGGVAMARGQTPHGIFAHGTSATYPHGILMDLSTYLDASENIRIYTYWAGNSMRFHGAHSIFHGYLVT